MTRNLLRRRTGAAEESSGCWSSWDLNQFFFNKYKHGAFYLDIKKEIVITIAIFGFEVNESRRIQRSSYETNLYP